MTSDQKKTIIKIIIFYILTLLLSACLVTGSLFLGASRRVLFNLAMWGPGLSALIVSIYYYRSLTSLGWGWGKTRYQLLSLAIPVIYCLATYNFIWFAGLGGFKPIDSLSISTIFLGILTWIIPALGEEIGWRGFLVPELSKVTTFFWVGVISGVMWGIWHLYPILFENYNQGGPFWFSIFIFFAVMIPTSIIMAWLRLKSGSLWTAVLFHSAHNYFVQSFFDKMTVDTGITHLLRGEFGIVTAISMSILALIFWTNRDKLALPARHDSNQTQYH